MMHTGSRFNGKSVKNTPDGNHQAFHIEKSAPYACTRRFNRTTCSAEGASDVHKGVTIGGIHHITFFSLQQTNARQPL